MTARHEVTACGTSTNSPGSWSVMQAPWPPGWLSLRLPLLASVSGTHLHILGTSSLGTYTYNQTLFSLLYITLFLLNFKVPRAVSSSFPFTECLSLSNSRFNVLLLVSVMKMVKPQTMFWQLPHKPHSESQGPEENNSVVMKLYTEVLKTRCNTSKPRQSESIYITYFLASTLRSSGV